MINFYNRITKKKQEQLFYDHGILNEEGRLTDEGMSIFLDLLFIGKSAEEAKSLIQAEIEKELENKQHSGIFVTKHMEEDKKKEKVVFTRKISRSGQQKILLITIPASVQPLLEFGKMYKITMEEM